MGTRGAMFHDSRLNRNIYIYMYIFVFQEKECAGKIDLNICVGIREQHKIHTAVYQRNDNSCCA